MFDFAEANRNGSLLEKIGSGKQNRTTLKVLMRHLSSPELYPATHFVVLVLNSILIS